GRAHRVAPLPAALVRDRARRRLGGVHLPAEHSASGRVDEREAEYQDQGDATEYARHGTSRAPFYHCARRSESIACSARVIRWLPRRSRATCAPGHAAL